MNTKHSLSGIKEDTMGKKVPGNKIMSRLCDFAADWILTDSRASRSIDKSKALSSENSLMCL